MTITERLSDLIAAWMGFILAAIGATVGTFFAPPGATIDQYLWFAGTFALAVFFLIAAYRDPADNSPRSLPIAPESVPAWLLAIALALFMGDAWAWFLSRSLPASDAALWNARSFRTVTLFTLLGAWWLAAQGERR